MDTLEDISISCSQCAGESMDLVMVHGEMLCLACVNDNKKACCGE